MSESIPISLKKLLGEKSYLEYLRDFVFPEIKQLAEIGKLSEIELAKIAHNVQKKGIDILNPEAYFRSDITRNTFHEAGWLTEAIHPLTKEIQIRSIIKKATFIGFFAVNHLFNYFIYNTSQIGGEA